jgi:hypothetical protein
MPAYQQTVRYRTYIKETLVEALRDVFDDHPDPLLRNTKVTVELPTDESSFPAIIVRYYNRRLNNAGIGHHEWMLATPEGYEPKLYQKFKHFMYSGDVEFKIMALSSKDRDFLADALVQTLGMAETEAYSRTFLERVYNADPELQEGSKYHFINLATDEFSELGDQEGPAPWMEEDLLVYSSTFRIPIFGEFYSRLLTDQTSYGIVQKVEFYPWIPDMPDPVDPITGAANPDPTSWNIDPETGEPNPNPEDEAPWLSSEDVTLG